MINQFLVTYLSKSSDHSTQQNMLQAISKILQFTAQEKEKLGLVDPSQQQRGFSQSLVNFLMNDWHDYISI